VKGLAGRRVALATRHGKEAVIAPALGALDIAVEVAPVDTDAFGTFTGEVRRPGDMLETAIAKARAGMAASGLDLGLASEGAYGGGFGGLVGGATELLVLVDDRAGRVLHLVRSGLESNQAALSVAEARLDAGLEAFLARVGFPAHGLVVFAEGASDVGAAPVAKGIVAPEALEDALARAIERSASGRARVESDMRAHLNPTRMARIGELATAFAQRLATPCPACDAWGFGPVDARRGLPCADCGAATSLVRTVVSACDACGLRAERPRDDGLVVADPQWCPLCNP